MEPRLGGQRPVTAALSPAVPATDPHVLGESGTPYLGWLVGFLVIVAVFVVCAGLWVHYHGL